jgi:hypothetical protein
MFTYPNVDIIGNGVFGGLVPILGLSFIQATGNIYAGLAWPMTIASICFIKPNILNEHHDR